MAQPMDFLVNVPLTDLRRAPAPAKNAYGKDPRQETQLLLGERLRLAEEESVPGWLYVEAPEQPRLSALKGWLGYQGWVQRAHLVPVSQKTVADLVVTALWAPIFQQPNISSPILLDVSLGTYLQSIAMEGTWWQIALPDGQPAYVAAAAVAARARYAQAPASAHIGQQIAAEAHKFLGSPYHWGGRSAYRAGANAPLTGVDCSGLSSLLYRVQGIDIPRDAHDQFLKSQHKASGAELQAGDLVFTIKGESPLERMDHVMVYVGGDEIVEATLTHGQVRRERIYEKCGRRLADIAHGERIGESTFYFGSFLSK